MKFITINLPNSKTCEIGKLVEKKIINNSLRIPQAWKKFWSLKHILSEKTSENELEGGNTRNMRHTSTNIWLSNLVNIRLKQIIQVCQRKITHVTLRDRVWCEDLRRSTGMRDASNLAERLKWKLSGHFARVDNNRWTHKLTMWDPREGRRNVGRQRTRWADQLKRLAGDQWSRSAKDRVLWKELE